MLYQGLVTKKNVDIKFRWVAAQFLGVGINYKEYCLSTVWEGGCGRGGGEVVDIKKNSATTPAKF